MSRNFELLHEAGKVQEMLRQPVEEPTPLPAEFIPSHPLLEIEGMARNEVTKLVQRLFLRSGARGARQVVFAPTERGNGSSWTCAHAADILAAQTPGSVCLVDCDWHAPALHTEFQTGNHRGLAEALLCHEPVQQFARQLAGRNLWLLSSGSWTEQSQQLLSSERMRKRMAELRDEFDYVLLDAPPLNASSQGIMLGSWCDGVALVLKANSSSRKSARKALDDLQTAKVPVLGAVLNQRTFPIPQKIYDRL